MLDKLVIRSKDELFEQIVVEGLKANAGRDYMKNSLIDAMRKEFFDTLMFRLKVDDINDAPHTPKNREIVDKVIEQIIKKWRSLVKECNKWTQTLNLITEADINHIWDEQEEDEDDGYEFGEAEDPAEADQTDEMTAEWPELNEEPVDSDYLRPGEEYPIVPGQRYPAGYWMQ